MSSIDKIINESPFSTEVKRSVWMILSSVYFKPKSDNEIAMVYEAENYVLENGVFIGAMSKYGFFICDDIDSVLESMWITIALELDVDETPGKIFLKRMRELYAQSQVKFP